MGQLTRASELFRKSGLDACEATELTELISDMASRNIIERFEAKMDANAKSLNAQMDAQTEKIDAHAKIQNRTYYLLIWAIGFATVILSGVMIFTRNG